jgi:hypothetical protein
MKKKPQCNGAANFNSYYLVPLNMRSNYCNDLQ